MILLMAAAFAATIALCIAYNFLTKKKPKLPYPSSPPGHFLWGNAPDLPDVRNGGHLDTKLLEWAKIYGLVFSFKLPIVGRFIVCADPELARHVLIKKDFPKSFTYKGFTPVVGERSIVLSEGQDWFHKRRAFTPGFAPNFLKNVVTVISTKLQRFLTCIDQDVAAGMPTQTLLRSQTFTSDVIVQVAFGEDWGGSEPHAARQWETELGNLIRVATSNPLIKYFGVRTWRKIRKLERLLDDEMAAILERRLEARAASGDAYKKQLDICSIAIDQMQSKDGTVTADDKITIVHQLKTFYFAGHDTTATLISWAVWLLSQHDQELATLRKELKEQKIWQDSDTPTYEQLQQCKYLDAILKEALRLYPPASSARYTCDVSETWGSYTIGGAILYVSAYVMQRHPDLWDRPDDFVPSRFMEPTETYAAKFMAFSRGPRDCLGKYFAMLEAKMALSALVLKYDLDCVNPKDKICYRVTAVPMYGAQVKFSHRE